MLRELFRTKHLDDILASGAFNVTLMGIGASLFTIPHSSTSIELYDKMMSGFVEGKRTIIAFACIGLGSVLGIIGLLFGSGNQTAGKERS